MNSRDIESSYFYNTATIGLGVLTLIPIVIAFLSYALFKKKKSKEDIMHLQKLSIKIFLYFSFFIIFTSYLISTENSPQEEISENTLSDIVMFLIAICLIALGFIDLKINYEKYMKFYDPTFVINDFITQRAKNVSYEVFYAIFAVIATVISYNYINFDYLLNPISAVKLSLPIKNTMKFLSNNLNLTTNNFNENKISSLNLFKNATDNINKTMHDPYVLNSLEFSTESVNGIITQKYLISSLLLVYPILLTLNIGSFVLKIKQLKMMTSIAQDYKYNSLIEKDIKLKKKVEIIETIFIIFNFLYIISSIILIYSIYNKKANNIHEDIEYEYSFQLKCLSLYFIVTNFFESVFFMFYVSRTDFYKFTLGNTSFAKIYSVFLPDVVEKPTISIDSSFNNFNTANFYKERAKELNSTCLFFHNNLSFSIDEIFVNMFDNSINIIFAAITKIVNDKAKNGPYNISKSANNLSNNSNRLESNHNNNGNFNFNNNFLSEAQNKNGFFSEEEYESETEKKQINSKSFIEQQRTDLNTNTNLNLNFKETDFKTTLISQNEKNEKQNGSNLKTLNNKRSSNKANSIKESSNVKVHEFKICESHNDLKDEKLLRLININAEKEQVQIAYKNSLETNSQKIQDENGPFDTFSNKNQNRKDTSKGDFNNQRHNDLSYLLSGMNLNLEIKEYYEKEFQEILSLKKINFNQLEKSFMSHFNQQQNTFNSLFSNNAKEELFKKQDNLVIRTNDKLYNFEILTNCNDNLDEDNIENGNLLRYTKYLKERESTFLPYIIGVYKIKINNFKEIKIVISKNNLIDEIPKENFNYWQLMRIKEKDSFQMITSSKDRQSLLVSDEILIKNDTKFNMVNYNDFGKILFSDLDFLRRINSSKYSLLIMYYEMGKNAAHNSQNSVTDDDIKNFRDKYGRVSNTSNKEMNNTNNNISAIRPFGEPSGFDFSLKNDLNLIQIVNGFQANVNEFRCILFFMFDNIFKKNKFYEFSNLCSSNHEKFEIMSRNKFNEIKD